jgi:hypothetical protein
MPVTMPVDDPIVAIPVLALLHVPPEVLLPNVVEVPGQAFNVPVMFAGMPLAVMVNTALQPPVAL